jgi:hypothetical protein
VAGKGKFDKKNADLRRYTWVKQRTQGLADQTHSNPGIQAVFAFFARILVDLNGVMSFPGWFFYENPVS